MLLNGPPTVARLGKDAFLIAPRGELDAATVASLEHALASARESGASRVIVDLAAVTFLDSANLSLLVRWADELAEGGGEVVVTTDDYRIARVFRITGFDRVIRVERSLMEAVDELVR